MNENNKKIVIAIHGAGMHAGVWGAIISCLDDNNISESISFPAHGGVKGELLDSIESMSDWLSDKLKEHKEDSIILMGHSMGALVALETAENSKVSALVLLGTSEKMAVNADLLKLAKNNPNSAKDMVLKYGIYKGNTEFETIKNILNKQMENVQPEALFNDLNACNNYLNGKEKAEALKKPVLIISGSEDRLATASAGKVFSEMLNNSKFSLIEDCGHMLMFEQPTKVAKEINSFIESI